MPTCTQNWLTWLIAQLLPIRLFMYQLILKLLIGWGYWHLLDSIQFFEAQLVICRKNRSNSKMFQTTTQELFSEWLKIKFLSQKSHFITIKILLMSLKSCCRKNHSLLNSRLTSTKYLRLFNSKKHKPNNIFERRKMRKEFETIRKLKNSIERRLNCLKIKQSVKAIITGSFSSRLQLHS